MQWCLDTSPSAGFSVAQWQCFVLFLHSESFSVNRNADDRCSEEIEMCSVSQEPGSTRGPENARQSAPSGRYQNTVKRLNDAVAKSVVGYLFRLDGSGHVSRSSLLSGTTRMANSPATSAEAN
jgi:hypothetical protein